MEKRKRRFGDPKFKFWWNDSIQNIHNKMIEFYIAYKNSGFASKEKALYNNAKREFRAKKRLNITLKRDRCLRNLNSLFQMDKTGFWKKIKSMNSKQQNVDIEIAKIKDDRKKIDIIFYADDILLISTTKLGIQKQLDVVQSYGEINEIKYNPSKTSFIIFNSNIKLTKKEKSQDLWQQNLLLNGDAVEKIKKMKYLGIILTDDGKNSEHITKCKNSALKALNKLKKLSIISNEIHSTMKGHLYNTFIRPVIHYGLENFHLNKSERLVLKRLEGNLVKMMIGVPTRCRSTDLLCALKIEPTMKRLDALKCDFYLRLKNNSYTNALLESIEILEESLPNEINEIKSAYNINESELHTVCQTIKYHTKTEFKATKLNNPNVTELHKLFNTKNRQGLSKKIFEIIKF